MTPEILGYLTFSALLVVYFIPVLHAARNNHPDGSLLVILLINAATGWTVVGWVIAALMSDRVYPERRWL